MEFDNSWRAVFRPAAASEYFSPPPAVALRPAREYDLTNAWWLAELSRLVYRDEPAGGPRRRDSELARVGLEESRFFHEGNTQCAIVEPRGESAAPVAALVFRGTDGPVDWGTNVKTRLVDWPRGGTVHAGFKEALDAVWQLVESALDGIAAPVFYAGHSLGGALAMLAASLRPPLAVYAFGAPRVGNAGFAETLAAVPVYRVVNRRDSVPSTPPHMPGLRYHHAGELCPISIGAPAERAKGKGTGGKPGYPPLPGRRRWYEPPGNICDHAPVNYVACLERLAGGAR